MNSNPTVGNIVNALDQAEDGSIALPVTLVQATGDPINKSPTLGRLEQALVVAEDGSMALPVELVELAADGSTFVRVDGVGGGGGEGGSSGPVTWSNITGKPSAYPPESHDHDNRYYTRTEIDQAGFLLAQPDGETVEIQSGELKAKALSGLQLGVTQLNTWLSGTEGNIQEQINGILEAMSAIGRPLRYLADVETHADMMSITTMQDSDFVIVLNDETKDNDRTWYAYRGDFGMWRYMGSLSLTNRFSALVDTPNAYENGKLLRSGINGLYFDTPKWSEIDGRPDRTKAQIENAVDAAHSHPNRTSLDRINIIEQNGEKIITIDGVPYTPKKEKKEILSAYLSTTATISVNSYIKFNTVKPLSNIPYDPNTGMFTLTPGKSYRVIVSVMGAIAQYITIHFARGTEKTKSNPYGVVYGATTVTNRGSSGVLAATFTVSESSDGLYGILVGDIGNATSVELYGNRTMLLIEEVEA